MVTNSYSIDKLAEVEGCEIYRSCESSPGFSQSATNNHGTVLLWPGHFPWIISPPVVSISWIIFSATFPPLHSFFSLLPLVLLSLSSAVLREFAFAYLAQLVFLFDPYPSLPSRLLLLITFWLLRLPSSRSIALRNPSGP
jgi:hypothetical protein